MRGFLLFVLVTVIAMANAATDDLDTLLDLLKRVKSENDAENFNTVHQRKLEDEAEVEVEQRGLYDCKKCEFTADGKVLVRWRIFPEGKFDKNWSLKCKKASDPATAWKVCAGPAKFADLSGWCGEIYYPKGVFLVTLDTATDYQFESFYDNASQDDSVVDIKTPASHHSRRDRLDWLLRQVRGMIENEEESDFILTEKE